MKLVVALTVFVAFASWLSLESVAQSNTSAPEELQALTDEEIDRLLDGHELTFGRFPPPNAHANIEQYCAGTFVFVGPRFPVGGTYRIENNQLCRQYSASGDGFCTRYFRDGDGNHFQQRLNEPSPQPIEVRPTTCE